MALVDPEQAALSAGLHVRWPRVLGARRSELERFSVNDEAYVEFGPGLLQLLSLRLDSGLVLGTGLAPEWTVPIGAGCAAAYAVLELPSFDGVNTWSGLGTTMHWNRAAVIGETLEAYSRLLELGRTSARLPYRVHSRERGDLLVEGEFILVSVDHSGPRAFSIDPAEVDAVGTTTHGGAPHSAPTNVHVTNPTRPDPSTDAGANATRQRLDSPSAPQTAMRWTQDAPAMIQEAEQPRPELFGLTAPWIVSRPSSDLPSVGDMWEWGFPSNLLRLLANPIAGASEPLGRRFHPYGRIFESMGVHAALTMMPGSAPQRARVRRKKPVRQDIHFSIQSEVVSVGKDSSTTLHRLWQGDAEIGEIDVTVSRSASAPDE